MTVAAIVHDALYGAAAAVYVFLFMLLVLSRRGGVTRIFLAVACGGTAAWAVAAIAGPGPAAGPAGDAMELARSAAWCALMIHLLRRQFCGRRGMAGLTACLAALVALVLVFGARDGGLPSPSRAVLLGYLAIAVFGAFLADNLYRTMPAERRWHVNLLFIGIGGLFVYDLLFYADAMLFRQFSPLLANGRPIAAIIAAPLVAVTAARNRDWVIDIHVSREAVFHTGSLVASGILLLALATVGEAFRMVGPSWGAVVEIALVFGGVIAVGVTLTSDSVRSRLRHLFVDNFFSHRFDYRKEWLQCIETLSAPADRSGPGSRIIKALAAITDSPGGQLWMRDPEGEAFHWDRSWNLPPATGAEPADSAFAAAFRDGDWVIELEGLAQRPEWLAEIRGAWLAVPLNHLGRLLGFVVLATPRAPLQLGRETFDLLRIIGRQAASHAAEWQSAQAVLETRRLRDFGNRFAFAVHDMKNVAAQLSMIVQNAAQFRGDPEFHDDVLLTVEAALSRTNTLIARLRSEPTEPADVVSIPIDLIAEQIAAIRRTRDVQVALRHDGGRAAVAMDAAHLRDVFTHLCDNAIEAAGGQVSVTVHRQHSRLLIDIADDGAGMPAEFVRDTLFAPFGSTKRAGLGIGAYQARELIRSAGGDLIVQSRPGVGTTMSIVLPCLGQKADLPPLSPV